MWLELPSVLFGRESLKGSNVESQVGFGTDLGYGTAALFEQLNYFRQATTPIREDNPRHTLRCVTGGDEGNLTGVVAPEGTRAVRLRLQNGIFRFGSEENAALPNVGR